MKLRAFPFGAPFPSSDCADPPTNGELVPSRFDPDHRPPTRGTICVCSPDRCRPAGTMPVCSFSPAGIFGVIKTLSNPHQEVIRRSSGGHQEVIRRSSGGHQEWRRPTTRRSPGGHQEVSRRSSGGHQVVIRRSSDSRGQSGGHQEVIRRSSGGHREVIRRSSGGHQEVIRKPSFSSTILLKHCSPTGVAARPQGALEQILVVAVVPGLGGDPTGRGWALPPDPPRSSRGHLGAPSEQQGTFGCPHGCHGILHI